MPQRGLLAKHQKLCFYLQASSMFPTLPEGSVEYYILSENRIVDSKKCYQKLYIWANIHFSNFFIKLGRIFDLKFFFISFLPFLCKGVTSANFKIEGKCADLIAPFMLVHKNSKNISIFFLIILVGISVFGEDLILSNLRISFSISPIFTFWK